MTAIEDVDVSRPLRAIGGLAPASHCLLVLRWGTRVVGCVTVPVHEGAVTLSELASAVSAALTRDAVDCWFHDAIGYDERRVVRPRPFSVAVAICTRERPEDLARALAALGGRQQAFEMLVIDNAPRSGATAAVVARSPSVRYVREDRVGLDVARNRALRETNADIVAFTDDDAVAEPGWVEALLANFQDPRVACVTGLTLPLELETRGQELFERHCSFIKGFRRRVFDGRHDNPLAVGMVGAGANMAVRRDVVVRLGGFDERLDGGTPTRSGGDHDLFVRLLAAGHQIVYDPAAVVRHRHRRTERELLETVHGYGVGVYAMWTGLLRERHELGVLRLAWQWLTRSQLPSALWARDRDVRRLARAELRGCLQGPRAWHAARRLRTRGA